MSSFEDEISRMLAAAYLREYDRLSDELIRGQGTGEPTGLAELLSRQKATEQHEAKAANLRRLFGPTR